MLEHGTEDSCLTVDVESEMLIVQKCKVDIIFLLFKVKYQLFSEMRPSKCGVSGQKDEEQILDL